MGTMNGNPTLVNGSWLELILVLAVGGALIPTAAWFATRWIRPAFWRRALWQSATLALLALLLVELSGMGSGMVAAWHATSGYADARGAAGRFLPPAKRGPTPEKTLRRIEEAQGNKGTQRTKATQGTWTRTTGVSGLGVGARSATTDADKVERAVVFPVQAPLALLESEVSGPSISTGLALWTPWLWALGTVLLVARIVWAHLLTVSLGRRRIVPADVALQRVVGDLGCRLRVGRRVRVVHIRGLSAPIACGVVRARIALPVHFAEQFSGRQREAVLVHELAHLAARDPAWQLLADLVVAALWWHPGAWWSRRRLRMAAESAADQASLLLPGGPDHLATSLVVLGKQMAVPTRLGWLSVGGAGLRSHLARRVERLLKLRDQGQTWRTPGGRSLWTVRGGVTVALVVVVIISTAWTRSQAVPTDGGFQMNVLRTSWNHSLMAAATLALLGPAASGTPADEGPPVAQATSPAPNVDWLVAMRDDDDHDDRDAPDDDRAEAREPKGEEQRARGERPDLGEMMARFRAQHEKLERRANEIREKIRALKDGKGKSEERERLANTLHDAEGQMQQIERQARDFQQDRIREQLERMRQQAQRLAKAGRQDEAERVEREARRVARQLQREAGRPPRRERPPRAARGRRRDRPGWPGFPPAPGRPPRPGQPPLFRPPFQPGPRPGMPEDVGERLEHLRIAVENLHAAGLHEPAEDLTREIERMEREAHGPEGRPEPPPEHGRPEPLEPVVHELLDQVTALRDEMHAMHEQFERLRDRIDHEEKEETHERKD